MSATARAAGTPGEDRPGRRTLPPPREDPGPRAVGGPREGLRPAHHSQTRGEPLDGAGRGRTLQEGRRDGAVGSLRTGTPTHATGSGSTARTGPAPARGHTAPVRAGSLRSRTAAKPAPAALPAPRPASGSPASRLRSAVGAHRAPLVLLVVTLLVATTLGLLVLNTAIAVNSLKATQLAAANEDRAQEVQRLEQQVIAGGTPAELAREARDAGLVPAGPAAYLVVGEDGSVTLRGEAVPAEQPEPSEVPALPAPPVAGGGD